MTPPGPALDELGDAHADELADRFLPAHGAADLRLERRAGSGPRRRRRRRCSWRRRARARRCSSAVARKGARPGRGGGHEARMIRAGDLERDDFPDALFLRERGHGFHFLHAAGKDDLAGAIEVGDVDVAGRGDLARLFRRGAEQRGHGADGGVAGLLHERAALGDEVQAGLEGERAGGGVRGVFAEREPRRGLEAQRAAGVVLERGEERQAVHIERGLADARLGQDFLRALEAVLADGPAEAVVGAVRKARGPRRCFRRDRRPCRPFGRPGRRRAARGV